MTSSRTDTATTPEQFANRSRTETELISPSRTPAEQGAGSREQENKTSDSPSTPTTTTSTHATPTLDGPTNIRDIYEERYAEREERPTTDQTRRPVSPAVARDRAEIRGDLAVGMGAGLRSIVAEDRLYFDVEPLLVELERTEGDLAVAVREANHHRALVAKVAELHRADAVDPDWCASCVTTAWPCPTSTALGGGRR